MWVWPQVPVGGPSPSTPPPLPHASTGHRLPEHRQKSQGVGGKREGVGSTDLQCFLNSGGSNSPWSEFWSEFPHFMGMGVVPAPPTKAQCLHHICSARVWLSICVLYNLSKFNPKRK